jgi:hypothetical protein
MWTLAEISSHSRYNYLHSQILFSLLSAMGDRIAFYSHHRYVWLKKGIYIMRSFAEKYKIKKYKFSVTYKCEGERERESLRH